jgi:hypothetical protein
MDVSLRVCLRQPKRRERGAIPRLSRALQMESYPKFHNEVRVPIVRIGCREFKCVGDKPPQITHTSTSIWAMPTGSFARTLDAIPFQSELGRI